MRSVGISSIFDKVFRYLPICFKRYCGIAWVPPPPNVPLPSRLQAPFAGGGGRIGALIKLI